ncbi:citrate lyase acyl carrier protein [Gephyromycinifex aptenodytis]|uniref:citrate lyase acyl carrier protein n=1 Tax=Gephyromycinifex aptenodytis TaxID=2716227 RepID=UPI001447C871|nr:citrate lyase acyl carrier protein [Gephyromycinifex aptenodytis]
MRIVRDSLAGTLESSDALVRVSPTDGGERDVSINSSVMAQFGTQITEVVQDTLDKMGVSQGQIVVEDKGALDCTLRARVQAAVLRACADEATGTTDASTSVDWSLL